MAETASTADLSRRLAAQTWADLSDLIDRQLSPLGLIAIEALIPRRRETIVDVGCGAGQTVLQLAERVGPEGRVVGVDRAPALLEVARRRAFGVRQVRFLECDACYLDLDSSSVDGIFSRFGVMAFEDPVAAFRNFYRILKPNGRLTFVCWRSLEENELDYLPLQAAALDLVIDHTPFSLEQPSVVQSLLQSAGFHDITIRANDQRVSSGDLDAMMAVLLGVGPLGKIIRENPNLRAAVEPRLRAVLSAQSDHRRVTLNAATWIVTAKA